MRQALSILWCAVACGCQGESAPALPSRTPAARLTQAEAVALAIPALIADMGPEYVRQYQPYRAQFGEGVWLVYGSLPDGSLGGTPAVSIRDRDGQVLAVYHTQ